MLNNHFYCIIMAGGIGSRFWPISRADKPKQFLDFTAEGKSFLRFTYDRMRAVIPDDNILVISLTRYEQEVKRQRTRTCCSNPTTATPRPASPTRPTPSCSATPTR